jgi:hypothetical protein
VAHSPVRNRRGELSHIDPPFPLLSPLLPLAAVSGASPMSYPPWRIPVLWIEASSTPFKTTENRFSVMIFDAL